ncbi:hypothetical protein ABZ345_14845 [Lentzea sp. NPDC005914]|uniref:LGFP repeat-containing protein n=1 Tax=Lentzea sp. NPDC005914 TaxID=3154572 RepID=UPI0033C22A62
MSGLRWEDFEDSAFERVVEELISREHDGATSIDGGTDVRWAGPDGLVIFECRKFTQVAGPQQRQIQESLARAAEHRPSRWILVVPTDLTPGLHAWFTELGAEHDFPLEWRGRTWLDERMAVNSDLAGSTHNELVAGSAENVVQAGVVHGGVHFYARQRWAALFAVVATLALGVVVVKLFTPSSSDTPATCEDIGNKRRGVRDPVWYEPFKNAYERGGSAAALGCPITEDPSGYVHPWAKGMSQDLAGGRAGQARIMTLKDPDRVFIMQGDYFQAYTFGKNLGDKVLGVNAAQHMGYPVSDLKPCGNAEVALLDEAEFTVAGSVQTPGAMVTNAKTGKLVWIPKDIWQRYKAIGGPRGRLGRPVGTATERPTGLLQYFEHGYLTTTSGVARTDVEERGEPEPAPNVTVDDCMS